MNTISCVFQNYQLKLLSVINGSKECSDLHASCHIACAMVTVADNSGCLLISKTTCPFPATTFPY